MSKILKVDYDTNVITYDSNIPFDQVLEAPCATLLVDVKAQKSYCKVGVSANGWQELKRVKSISEKFLEEFDINNNEQLKFLCENASTGVGESTKFTDKDRELDRKLRYILGED